MIRNGVKQALLKIDSIEPFMIPPPYFIEVKMSRPENAINYTMFPGAKLIDSRTVAYETSDLYKAIIFVVAFGAKFL